ncbi:MAG TPA: Na(+)-translocating NADH-quinone reductase subunit A [Prolixibacteraceae bacterium]|nr:Na(+)-translocating NADH-quinone reductase subunit A [Prolixibacteraceae bacterium]
MSKVIKLRKGLNIKLQGRAEEKLETLPTPSTVAIKPTDFPGLIPKLSVKAGSEVKTGDALFYDKYYPDVVLTAPMGGIVKSVNRGERRRILEIVIEPGADKGAVDFGSADPASLNSDEVKNKLLKSGLWPFLRRRPYGITASPADKPKAIFISTFDTSPLAPNYNFILEGQLKTFQTGVNALAKLTEGKVHLGVNKGSIFNSVKHVEINEFEGPHPAGNVGVQIHHVAPIAKGEVVWTINVQDVLFIGRLFETGKVDFTKTIAMSGSEIKKPQYYKTIIGAPVSELTDGKITDTDYKQRIISGNVLTGEKVKRENYLGFFDSQITVIPEGDEYEFLGWASLGVKKFSASKTFMSSLLPNKQYKMNANLHGGERAFVLTDQYDKVVPMDVLPVILLKAILANDIDKMEQLGIYEIVEEDFALCEYICTSKIKVQDIVRSGIDTMIKELG